jgi:NADPH-dependent 2,4-dienoyl-CoA reductase/sulfur reductase-like enzyme
MNAKATGEQVVVIVGAGLAGGNAAVTLREEGWRGRIVLLGAEPGIPFGRPPLSKTYLRGEEDLSAWHVKPAEWYGDHDVELRTGSTVRQVDTALKQVRLRSASQAQIMKELNPNIWGWSAYYRTVVAAHIFGGCDAVLWHQLWRGPGNGILTREVTGSGADTGTE